MTSALPLDKATLRALAVEASCDPRTIALVAKGDPVRGMAGHRARAVLVARGYVLPATPTTNGEGDAGGR